MIASANKPDSVLSHQNIKFYLSILVPSENPSRRRSQHRINSLTCHTIEDIISALSENKRCLKHQDPDIARESFLKTRETIQKELESHINRNTVSVLCQLASQSKACFAADPAELNSFKTEVFAINLSSAPGPRFQPIKPLTRRRPLMQAKLDTTAQVLGHREHQGNKSFPS